MNDDQTPQSELEIRFTDIEAKLDDAIAQISELEEQAQAQKVAFESELAALRLELKRIKSNA